MRPQLRSVCGRLQPPNSVVSIDQKGGITAGTVNINEFPEPKFESKPIALNVEENGVYKSRILFIIESRTALKNLYLEARAPSIVSFDVGPQRTGAFIQGHSGMRSGFAFTNIPSAYGTYRIEIVTSKPEQIELTYDYE